MSEATLVALCLGFLGFALCIHSYDLSKNRVQQVARNGNIRGNRGYSQEIQRNFCFVSVELQELFELWWRRALFWRALDWGAVLHMTVFTVKIAGKAECGAVPHAVLPLGVTSLMLVRVLLREKLSSGTYSLLSLLASALIWITDCGFLLAGDRCFGALGKDPFAGPVPAQVLFACTILTITNLITPVSQPYVPLKFGIGFVGSISSSYLHVLYRDGALHREVDPEGWNIYWLCVGIATCSLATFHVNTRLVEAGMLRFLGNDDQQRRRRED